MEIGSPSWHKIIREGAVRMGIALTADQREQLARHATELLRWNRKTNLTSITDPADVAVKHVLDSLAPLPLIPSGARLLDIGSGGGFPGLVLKIANPHLSITLVDAVRKKVSFLNHVIRTLGLKDIQARHSRVEALAKIPPYTHGFDVIVCRALCALEAFVSMALPLLAPAGTLIALKGREEETKSEMAGILSNYAQTSEKKVSGRDGDGLIRATAYRLPHLDIERTLVTMRGDMFCRNISH